MLQLFTNINVPFMKYRRLTTGLSVMLVVGSIVAIGLQGLNFGIDFTGGTLLQLKYPNGVVLDEVRGSLDEAGFDKAVVQNFGTSEDVLVRLAPREELSNEQVTEQVLQQLRSDDSTVELERQEFVGPQVGEELTQDGGLAMLAALIGILIYVGLRFEPRLALGSVIALVHDVIITLGIFALLQLPFDLTVLAAVLAVIGYSLNDTIVVYDRIRENFRKMRKGEPEEIINASLNQTISRTTITSLTTLLVLIALFVWGGEMIHGFATALIIGVVIGTYSSIYVASAAAIALGITKESLMPVEKEGVDMEDHLM